MKKWFLLAVLLFVLYLILGAVLPFVFHPQITEETKQKTEQLTALFMGEENPDTAQGEPVKERAMILADNGPALSERIRLISQARERIILSTFEFRTDESGLDMLAALQAAANRGVEVQVIVDGMAAVLRLTGNPYFQALSAAPNAQIRIYNPVTPLRPWNLMGRMHDKYLIADDRAYIMGGRNTYDFFLGDHDGYINYDWDVLVYGSGEGAGASMEQLTTYFEEIWAMPICKTYHDNEKDLEKTAVKEAAAELESRYAAMQKEHPDWFDICDYEKETLPTKQIALVTNPTHRYAKEPTVYYMLTQLMARAKEEVRFHTPYIICNDWMLEQLQAVCQTVPHTVMMTNSVANNGNPFGAMDYGKHKEDILNTGVEILEYDGGVSYHGKCFVADDHLSGIGSFNWDMRSAYLDTEMMLLIDSREVNAALRQDMARYEADALLVDGVDSYILPEGTAPQESSLTQRVQTFFLGLFAGWARFLM